MQRGLVVVLLLATAALAGPGRAQATPEAGHDPAYREARRLMRGGDHVAAAETLERVVAADPRSVDAWLDLGISRAALEQWPAAVAAYRRVIELEPGHAKALHNLGNISFRQGLYDEAAEWYRRALEQDDAYLLAAFHYGWVLRQLGRADEAEHWFGRCLELPGEGARDRKTRFDCLFYLGTMRFRAGDYARSAELMERVLGVQPAHAEARYYLGMAYRRLGRVDDAREQLEIHRSLLRAARSPRPIERDREP